MDFTRPPREDYSVSRSGKEGAFSGDQPSGRAILPSQPDVKMLCFARHRNIRCFHKPTVELYGKKRSKHIPTMSCRIDRVVIEENLVILRISGWIAADYVNMLRALLEQERARVAIDLKDVLLVDRDAVKLLALRESNGAELRNCPAYIREWVTRERTDSNALGGETEGREEIENA